MCLCVYVSTKDKGRYGISVTKLPLVTFLTRYFALRVRCGNISRHIVSAPERERESKSEMQFQTLRVILLFCFLVQNFRRLEVYILYGLIKERTNNPFDREINEKYRDFIRKLARD